MSSLSVFSVHAEIRAGILPAPVFQVVNMNTLILPFGGSVVTTLLNI
jgi:hypothetical protein